MIPAGKVFGVPLGVGASWLLIVPAVGWTLFAGTPGSLGSLPARTTVAAAGTALVFLSILFHEVGHAAAALRLGVPVRSISVFLVGGYTDMDLDAAPPRVETAVAVSGPAFSAGLAVLLGVGAMFAPGTAGLERTARVLVLVNVAVVFFNLLPVFPLDGGRVLRGMLRDSGWDSQRAERLGSNLGIGLGAAFVAFGLSSAAGGVSAAVLALPAGTMLVFLGLSGRSGGAKVAGDIMRGFAPPVGETDPAAAVAGPGPVPVVTGGRVVGLVEPGSGRGLVGEVMDPVLPGDVFSADAPLERVRRHLATTRRPVVVVAGGTLVGLVIPEDVLRKSDTSALR